MKYCGCCIIYGAFAMFGLFFLMAINFYTPLCIIFAFLCAALVLWGQKALEEDNLPQSTVISNKIIRKAVITEKDYRIFRKCWLYTDFIKQFGKVREIKECTNSTTGKQYKACIIYKEKGNILWVGFSTSLGELTLKEISDRKEELKVGLTDKGNYKLYDYKIEPWEIIEFEGTEIKEIQEISKPSTVKEKVVDFNALKIEIENKIKEVNKPIAQLSTNKSFNINIITPNQRRATFGLIAYLGKRQFESNQEDADKIINTYAEILQISKEDYNFIMSGIQFSMFFEYFCDIEKIKIDEYWNFLFKAWRELINKDTGKRKLLYYKLYKTMKKALYFTNDEIDAVLQGKDIHKYNH